MSVDITNTGKVAGEEVVQLYVRYPNSAVQRPREELKGFERIHLAPGEVGTVRFCLPARELAYWNEGLAGGARRRAAGSRRILRGYPSQHHAQHCEVSVKGKSVVIVVKSNGMGQTADQDLREALARKFLTLIADADPLPAAICFYTDGVRLACSGSPLLPELRALEARGVHLVLCKTCLDKFGLADQVELGVVGGMPDIITAMWSADTVIEL